MNSKINLKINSIIKKGIEKFYKKNKFLPKYDKLFVSKNIIKKGDLLDYMIELKNNCLYISYTYYEKETCENKFIMNSLKINLSKF